jgi:hypothetical protein
MDQNAALVDSKQMFNRPGFVLQARMPSMRPSALNTRRRAAKGEASGQSASPAAQAASEDDATAGGFHESSYELRHGLEISESEWPPDVTIPGALGDR